MLNNIIKIIPGLALVLLIIYFVALPPDSNYASNIIPVALCGFSLAIYALIDNKKLWGESRSNKKPCALIRIVYTIIGILSVAYSLLVLIYLVVSSCIGMPTC